jgi:hypothetical protein
LKQSDYYLNKQESERQTFLLLEYFLELKKVKLESLSFLVSNDNLHTKVVMWRLESEKANRGGSRISS